MQRTQAFSLVELAVVITIIGLLLGGVLATNSFLVAAKQKTLINESKLYLNALKQFQQKYGGALPGDMGNATSYWSGATNGNGDGIVGFGESAFLSLNHLALAGLINGTYSGVAGPNGAMDPVIGINAPALSMEGVTGFFYTPFSTSMTTGTGAYYAGNYGTNFMLTKRTNSPFGAFLTPLTARELDQKFDDGQPNYGWIRTYRNGAACVGGGTSYLPDSTTISCALIMGPL